MVAVRSSEADRFLANPPRHIYIYLVFGADAGLVSERSKALLKSAVPDPGDPFQLVRLRGDDISADPLRLLDEAHTIPLFAGKRAIHIDIGARQITSAIQTLLLTPPVDCMIVIEAGSIKRDAALRKLLEREKCAATIECHTDDARALDQLINQMLVATGLTLTQRARANLTELLGADRLGTRAELEKLALYCHGHGQITTTDIEMIVADASALAMDAAINGAFSGSFSTIDDVIEQAFRTGTDPNALLSAALRYASMLHRSISEGLTNTSSSLGHASRPPTFYGRSADFDRHLSSWTLAKLQRLIASINEATGKVRREPGISKILTIRLFWTIALASSGTRRRSSLQPSA